MKTLVEYINEGLFGGSKHKEPVVGGPRFSELQIGDYIYKYSKTKKGPANVTAEKVTKIEKEKDGTNIYAIWNGYGYLALNGKEVFDSDVACFIPRRTVGDWQMFNDKNTKICTAIMTADYEYLVKKAKEAFGEDISQLKIMKI